MRKTKENSQQQRMPISRRVFWLRMLLGYVALSALVFLLLLFLFQLTHKSFFIETFSSLAKQTTFRVMPRSSILPEYNSLVVAMLPFDMTTEIELACYVEEDTYSEQRVTMHKPLGEPQVFCYRGLNKMADYGYRNFLGALFQDEHGNFKLAVRTMPGLFLTQDKLKERTKEDWLKQADSKYPYVENGVFFTEETELGYRVFFEVGNESERGFLKVEYDCSGRKIYRFLYLEALSLYNQERAQETISSVMIGTQEISFLSEELVLEVDDMPEDIGIELFLEGAPWDLMQVRWSSYPVKTDKIGTYQTDITIDDVTQTYQVVVQDTLAPEPLDTDCILFVGDFLEADWVASNCFSDYSAPVSVTFTDGSDIYTIPEDAGDKNEIGLWVNVTDSLGNTSMCEVEFKLYEQSDLPEWLLFFLDTEDETLLESVRKGELEEIKQTYLFDYLYDENDIGEEVLNSAISGYKKVVRNDIEVIQDGEAWYGHELMAFYSAMDYLPEEVLTAYGDKDWAFRLTDGELKLGELECAGVTYYHLREIQITSLYSDFHDLRATTIHETGHFADSNERYVSNRDEQLEDFREAIAMEFGLTEEYLAQWEDEGYPYDPYYWEFRNGGYRQYSFSKPEEFFADSFYFYCMFPDIMEAEYPQIYEKMEELFE